MALESVVVALLAVAAVLSLPALVRAYRIAWFHRWLGPAAWRLTIAADAAARHRGRSSASRA